ncbi:biliverdin-producing heme oxygenase [Variovorax sp. J22R133]|uniref:biliverdin-producing heme oxygenase n=1 Tax=Variovorax brevis TaxID=3053503 RepID=UPI002577685E|nr:biliverdin-producing heme oxygenase [Variovorax sp. J22R133]MDM0113801.1 biliverdin-producing heme oxygenase [Variovorax sp. J22R133]
MPSLSESLKLETRELHTQAERSVFMRQLLRGEMERKPYCAMLRNLHAIYAAMEPALERHACDPRLAPLHFRELMREPALRGDLDALHGEGWREHFALQPSALRYVSRLRSIEDTHPELLAAHSYVRYLGDLSGGQILARIVRESMALPAGSGTAFYDFGGAKEALRLKKAYREGLDKLPGGEPAARAIVAEAALAFELHCHIFDELGRAEPG